MLQEGGVDDIADLDVGAADRPRQASRDDATLERLLQRRARTKVGDNRKPTEESEHPEHADNVAHAKNIREVTGVTKPARTIAR